MCQNGVYIAPSGFQGVRIHIRRTPEFQEFHGEIVRIHNVEPCAVCRALYLLDKTEYRLCVSIGVCQIGVDIFDHQQDNDEQKRRYSGTGTREPLALQLLFAVIGHFRDGAKRLVFRMGLFFFHSVLLFLSRRIAPDKRGCCHP